MHSTQPPGLVCLFKPHSVDLSLECGSSPSRRSEKQQGNLLVALTNQTRPIFDGVAHEAAVDVVELLMVCPLGFHIVDLEAYVRRHPTSHSDISERTKSGG